MGSQIEQLIEKYWRGETTLDEEQQLKEHFAGNQSSVEGQYWSQLEEQSNMNSKKSFTHPGRKHRQTWLSIAASIMLGVTVAIWVINDAKKQRDYVIEDPQEAYEMTRKALLMLSSNLNEGAAYSKPLNTINEAQELISENNDKKK